MAGLSDPGMAVRRWGYCRKTWPQPYYASNRMFLRNACSHRPRPEAVAWVSPPEGGVAVNCPHGGHGHVRDFRPFCKGLLSGLPSGRRAILSLPSHTGCPQPPGHWRRLSADEARLCLCRWNHVRPRSQLRPPGGTPRASIAPRHPGTVRTSEGPRPKAVGLASC